MIDYIDITKYFENKVTINFAHLQLEATYNSGWKKYVLKGCTHLEVWINKQLSLVRIKGSIPFKVIISFFAINLLMKPSST